MSNNITKRIYPLCLGQVLSILLSLSGISSSTLASRCNLSTPSFQNMCVYATIAAIYVPNLLVDRKNACRGDEEGGGEHTKGRPPHNHRLPLTNLHLSISPSYYILISFLDVLGNYLVVLSFSYTTLTSVSLIDCTTIPFVMAWSYAIFNSKFRKAQIIWAGACIAGILMTVAGDVYYPSSPPSPAPSSSPPSLGTFDSGYEGRVKGDAMALMGSVVYALNNVAAERLCKNSERVEYLGMLGLGATIWSGLIMSLTEISSVHRYFIDSDASTCSSGLKGGLLGLYVLTITLFYSRMTAFVTKSTAVMLNVSLLTSDIYSVIWQV
eukprot:CAMPEP_0118653012 /NCGR_PEP_ID=MMETSP0785-20121206/11615_1 /TAXON_ID=91992 /ORGANISM="Bolidomonas pacifica, Strain CCMP 1866" /LENGTH=323 /DNA_ID=CAMNT_0006545549 /DNA_START=356 /DNA_END=1323 /DNA_ORIENTATION=-